MYLNLLLFGENCAAILSFSAPVEGIETSTFIKVETLDLKPTNMNIY